MMSLLEIDQQTPPFVVCVCYLPRIDIVSVLLLTHTYWLCVAPPSRLPWIISRHSSIFSLLSLGFSKKDKKIQRQILGPKYISLISPDILGRGCMRRCGVARPSVTSKTGEKKFLKK